MADPEGCHVRDHLGGIGKGKTAVKLQSIGGVGDHSRLADFFCFGSSDRGVHGAAALLAHCFKAEMRSRIIRPVLQTQTELASPVGVLLAGSRQIDLFGLAEYVLHLYGHDL